MASAAKPPSFAAYFAGSATHFDSVLRRIQPSYRLNATWQWTLVDPDDKVGAHQAAWPMDAATATGARRSAAVTFRTALITSWTSCSAIEGKSGRLITCA